MITDDSLNGEPEDQRFLSLKVEGGDAVIKIEPDHVMGIRGCFIGEGENYRRRMSHGLGRALVGGHSITTDFPCDRTQHLLSAASE
jgi:hypothetical protein